MDVLLDQKIGVVLILHLLYKYKSKYNDDREVPDTLYICVRVCNFIPVYLRYKYKGTNTDAGGPDSVRKYARRSLLRLPVLVYEALSY